MNNFGQLNDILDVLGELSIDPSVPRNVKQKLTTIIQILKENSELSIKIDKALQELEEITEDTNLQSHVRTQLWNIVSLLEKSNF